MNNIILDSVFFVQTVVIFILAIIVIYVIKYNKSIKLEKRLSKYAIAPIDNSQVSLFDKLTDTYLNISKKLGNIIIGIPSFKKYSKKYSKYITYDNKKEVREIDFISNKILISITFLFIDIFARVIEGSYPGILEMILISLLGFFVIDIFFMFQDAIKKRQVEQELLNAIIIMNNAFRSGRSTIQAIEIVSKELKGPIKEEFKKMHIEISYGLSLDTVFERFGQRVDLEEVEYITSSLTILNKTGGNIIKVFASIEKSLFNKKTLTIELKTLTSSSSMISKTLLVLPFIFSAIIYFLNPNYFDPFFNTTLGNIIFSFILIDYIMYIYMVQKVMKVRF